ncbi:MAG TPA: hypothetical protein VHD88_06845 [Pyrinomonadaceae bacterium]|nr:hypothetical protein [Pyrinomonadaceae bacterium]
MVSSITIRHTHCQEAARRALREGISSISTGAGPCDGAHSLAENCEIEPLYKGIKKIPLLEIALAGMQ